MKTTLSLILIVLIGSCAPSRFVPYDYTSEQNNLQAYIDLEGVIITLENLEIQDDHYVFGMGIENNSATSMLIDTDKILKFAHYLSYQESEAQKSPQEIVPVMSPEQTIQLFKSKEKDSRTAEVLLFILGAAISTYDAVQDAKDYSKENWTRNDERNSVTRDIVAGASLLASDVLSEVNYRKGEKAGLEVQYLPNELFDKKVIAPGEEYYGKIFFKKSEALHGYHRISWPLQEISLFFDFRLASRKERKFLKEVGN